MCKKFLVPICFVLVLGLAGSVSAELNYEYYEAAEGAQYQALADVEFGVAEPNRVGTSDTLDSGDGNWVEQAGGHRGEDFAFRFTGYIVVPVSGETTFYLRSDDGSQLFIDGAMVVDNDGLHGTEGFPGDPGTITLDAGVYTFEATQFERGGGDSIHVAWSHGGFGARRVPDSVLFLEAPADISAVPATVLVETNAIAPVPSDGAVDSDATALEWSAGFGAVTHKVYLSSDETIDDADLIGETELTIQIATLDPGATYNWRVDEVDADGNVVEGAVWSFTTIPLEAHFPSPEDGIGSQALDSQLSWTGGKVVIMHDVYFGTDEAAIAARDMSTFKGKLMTASYDPGELTIETTYYWAVDQFTPTGTVAGPVWSFTTLGAIAITDPDLLLHYDFENGEGNVALDRSGHSNHGHFKGDPQWTTGPFGGAVSINIDTLDYIETAAPLGVTSNNVSVTGWVKHDELPAGWSGILTHRGSGNLGLQHNGTELRYMWGADQYWSFSSGLELPVGEWYFAALTIAPDQGKLYLNGVEQTATNVAPHDPVDFDSLIRVGRDHNDGRIMTSLIDEVRLYNVTLTDADIQGMLLSDVTAPGDVVQGVPNDGDWPGGETPDLAIDDDSGTKFLHFKGATEASGIQIEPAMGPTVVTALTFTTANDAEPRDPASFELSGSNESIDGPYELIASGDVSDFAMAEAWPRFTTNATAIAFANEVSYKYYQVMFPTVRDAANANSMQIAEVELLGVPGPIARWEFAGDYTATGGSGQEGIPVGDVALAVDPDRGEVLSLPGGDNQFVDLGSVGISGNMPKTITVWAKADHTDIPNWTLIFGFTGQEDGSGGSGSHFNIGSLGGPGGVGAHIWGWEETIFSDDEALEWRHYAMTYDGTTIQYYGDGNLMDTDLGKSNVRDLSASADRVHAGSRITGSSSFPGMVDDARIYSQALSAMQIAKIASAAPQAPSGYAFEGDAPDETWVHDNGSDQWDGTGPGEGNPGGAVSLTEDDVTFLRIQDIGDPRSLGISEPSNRKVYLTRLTDISLDGLRLEVRIRVATTPPLDNQVSGDPWPAEGIGYHIRDGGKGMIGVSDGVGIISFSLGQAGEADYVDATSDLLVMNNLVGAEPSGDVDTGEAAEMNAVAIADAGQWNTFVIDIVAGGAGTHVVTVSANGGPAESFDVTSGTDLEAEAPFIAIGSSGTGGITAFDVDYISVQ